MRIDQSKKLLKEAKKIIPTGGQTFSKGTHSFSENFSPSHAFKGVGNKIMDVDKNVYLDFVMGAQPLILGYADKDVNRAVKKQLDQGSTFSLANQLEIDVAKLLKQHISEIWEITMAEFRALPGTYLFVDTTVGMIGSTTDKNQYTKFNEAPI